MFTADGPYAKTLLIVDDEENMRHMLSALLKKFDYRIDTAADGHAALGLVEKTRYDFILCDIRMPGMDGMGFLKSARDRIQGSTVIMMSAYGSIDTAIAAMKQGAYDYISKPFKPDEVYLALKKAEEREALKSENLRLKAKIEKLQANCQFGDMVGQSPLILSVFKLAEKAAGFDTTVLITGESGTGKELVARGLHQASGRREKPMVPVNCGGIPENLLESELFGYIKGAFTGADKNKPGLFQAADKGTIFLDEIGEMPLALQVKLLRVLQENEIRPVGDEKIHRVNVRVVAATAKNLEREVREGRFREDLFYRLNVLHIKIPPLRDWKEDLPLLCRHFIDLFNAKYEKKVSGVAPDALHLLQQYHWPGNVRQLENVIERGMVLTEEAVLLPEHFPPELIGGPGDGEAENGADEYSLKAARMTVERRMIIKALTATNGNRTRAARMLEISHPSLLSKIKSYRIPL